MALDLEIAGVVRELAEGEEPPERVTVSPRQMRNSHHAVAKLCARGLTSAQVSLQTGYSLTHLWVLDKDPSFQELVTFYRRDQDAVAESVESKWLLIADDYAQHMHEKLLAGEDVPIEQAKEVFKVLADRAGFAPVQRSVNKNLNLNIGDRLDAARRRNARS